MKIQTDITSQRIADLFVTAIESGDPVTCAAKGGWCDGVFLESPGDVAFDDPAQGGPWYANPRLYEDPDLRLKIVALEDSGARIEHDIGLAEIHDGLAKLAAAKDYAHHFADILNENDDAATADIFLQFVVFGQEVYA